MSGVYFTSWLPAVAFKATPVLCTTEMPHLRGGAPPKAAAMLNGPHL